MSPVARLCREGLSVALRGPKTASDLGRDKRQDKTSDKPHDKPDDKPDDKRHDKQGTGQHPTFGVLPGPLRRGTLCTRRPRTRSPPRVPGPRRRPPPPSP
ncbi:hypothetical protein GCM10010275_12220 [Streptomyces litmocidini]|nr:hypothetical protein GCM10010275_12220 [Streptomyces litmocidini]